VQLVLWDHWDRRAKWAHQVKRDHREPLVQDFLEQLDLLELLEHQGPWVLRDPLDPLGLRALPEVLDCQVLREPQGQTGNRDPPECQEQMELQDRVDSRDQLVLLVLPGRLDQLGQLVLLDQLVLLETKERTDNQDHWDLRGLQVPLVSQVAPVPLDLSDLQEWPDRLA